MIKGTLIQLAHGSWKEVGELHEEVEQCTRTQQVRGEGGQLLDIIQATRSPAQQHDLVEIMVPNMRLVMHPNHKILCPRGSARTPTRARKLEKGMLVCVSRPLGAYHSFGSKPESDMDHAWGGYEPILEINKEVSMIVELYRIVFEPDLCVSTSFMPDDMPPQYGIMSKCNTKPHRRGPGKHLIGPRRMPVDGRRHTDDEPDEPIQQHHSGYEPTRAAVNHLLRL